MNKIILNLGFFVFFISLVLFGLQEESIVKVILRSIVVFFSVTIILSLLTLIFIKLVQKQLEKKEKINQEV